MKPPKTRNVVRDVPIPAALCLCSKAMHGRAAADAAAVPALMGERGDCRWRPGDGVATPGRYSVKLRQGRFRVFRLVTE